MFKKIVLGIVVLVAVVVAAFFFLIKVIDFNEYKPRLHKAIKESTGYEVIIRGDITLTLSPIGVSVSDIEVNNPTYHPETPFAKLGSFDVALDVPALLKKEIKVTQLSLDGLALNIEKIKDGKFNYDLLPVPTQKAADKKTKENNATVEKESDVSAFMNAKKIIFSNSTISYADVNATNKIVFEHVDLDINDISYDVSKHSIQGLYFNADTHIDKIQYGSAYAVQDISMSFELKNGIAVSNALKYTLFDTQIQGNGKFDFCGKQPKISLKSKIVGLKLASLSKELWGKDLLEGNANGDFKLSFFVGDGTTFKSTLNGFVQLSGEEITLKGYDIDKIALVLDPFQKEKLNLNTLISGTIEAFKGGNSVIKELNTKVDLGYSEIKLSDVALSTASNRIAIKGAVNIVDEKLMDVKAALLDTKGCAVVEQKFSGTYAKPSVKLDATAVATLKDVVLSFTTKSKITHTQPKQNDENCTVFYDGVIKQPELVLPATSVPPVSE